MGESLDHQEPVLRSAGENGFLSGDFQGAEKHVFMICFSGENMDFDGFKWCLKLLLMVLNELLWCASLVFSLFLCLGGFLRSLILYVNRVKNPCWWCGHYPIFCGWPWSKNYFFPGSMGAKTYILQLGKSSCLSSINGQFLLQDGAPKVVKLLYRWFNYGLW